VKKAWKELKIPCPLRTCRFNSDRRHQSFQPHTFWQLRVNSHLPNKGTEKLKSDLWEAADDLRANPKLTSSDYFMPVLGVIFLRHAANRFEAASRQIEEDQTAGRMPKRKIRPEDYLRRGLMVAFLAGGHGGPPVHLFSFLT